MRQVAESAKSGLTPTIFGNIRQKYQQLWSSLGRTLKGVKEPVETKSADIEGRKPQRRTLEKRIKELESENEVLRELRAAYKAKFERQRHLIRKFNAENHRLASRLRRLTDA